MFVVFDFAVKLPPSIMTSLAPVNIDMMVAARQVDDENKRLLNSCQRVNTDHELSYHGEFFPCSIFLSYLILRQDKSII